MTTKMACSQVGMLCAQEMGFDDVEQFLALELTTDERDGMRVFEQSLESVVDKLAPMPGHRARLMNFFHNETRRAQREIRDKMKSVKRSAAEQVAVRVITGPIDMIIATRHEYTHQQAINVQAIYRRDTLHRNSP